MCLGYGVIMQSCRQLTCLTIRPETSSQTLSICFVVGKLSSHIIRHGVSPEDTMYEERLRVYFHNTSRLQGHHQVSRLTTVMYLKFAEILDFQCKRAPGEPQGRDTDVNIIWRGHNSKIGIGAANRASQRFLRGRPTTVTGARRRECINKEKRPERVTHLDVMRARATTATSLF